MVEPGASVPQAASASVSTPVTPPPSARLLNLVGSFHHQVDDKRRVAIPRALRDHALGCGERDAWVVCRSLGGEPCLDLFPADRFALRLAALEGLRSDSLGVGNAKVRAYLRAVRETASEQVPDKQGRIVLTEEQKAMAGLDREAVFVGAGEKVELWAAGALERVRAAQDFAALTRDIFG